MAVFAGDEGVDATLLTPEGSSGALERLERERESELAPPTVDEQEQYGRDRRRLRLANLAAGVFHLLSFSAALILLLIYRDRVMRPFVTWTGVEYHSGSDSFRPRTHLLGRYSTSWTVLPFPVLTGLFHLVIALLPPLFEHYSRIVLHHGRSEGAGWNWLRWAEYSITASLMTWTIAQQAGVTELATLGLLMALNVCMQLYGGLGHEWVNVGWRRPERALEPSSGKPAVWWLFLLGFVPFLSQWAVIFAAFFRALSTAPVAADVPWFVWTVVIGLFFGFSSFVVPIVLHYARWQRWLLQSNASYEMAYIALSFLSKATLDWTLVIGAISRG